MAAPAAVATPPAASMIPAYATAPSPTKLHSAGFWSRSSSSVSGAATGSSTVEISDVAASRNAAASSIRAVLSRPPETASASDEASPRSASSFAANAARAASQFNNENRLRDEASLVAFFKDQGMSVYEPDVAAFRSRVQKMYLESEFSKDWPKGMVDRVNAVQ